MNSETYSISTSGHVREIQSALRGLNVRIFHVPYVTEHQHFSYANAAEMHARNLAHYAAAFEDAVAKLLKPHVEAYLGWDGNERIEDSGVNRAASLDALVVEMHSYADAFNLTARPHVRLDERKAEIIAAWDRFNDPQAVAKRARAKARRQARSEAEHQDVLSRAYAYIEGVGPRLDYDAQRTLKSVAYLIHAEYITALYRDPQFKQAGRKPTVTIDQWLNGLGTISDASAFMWHDKPGHTILRRKGDRLETSRGAEVPWSHAMKAFQLAQVCRRMGHTWRSNGVKVPVGHFQVDAIEADGTLHAGCHTLTWDEMLRLAVREIPDKVQATFPVPALIVS